VKHYIRNITFECAEPMRLAAFWSDVLGWMVEEPGRGTSELIERERGVGALGRAIMLVDPTGVEPRLYFQQVEDPPRQVHRRIHLDVIVDDADAEVQRLTELGARNARVMEDRLGPYVERWFEIEDPEGNVFTVQTEGATELP
jgi:Glyoxalase-like domain